MLRALEQIRRMRGGAQSHLMRCSDGYYYVVKFQNNPQHRRVLVNEMLGTRLAARLGLPTVPAAVVEVSEELIRFTPDLVMEYSRARFLVSQACILGHDFPVTRDTRRCMIFCQTNSFAKSKIFTISRACSFLTNGLATQTGAKLCSFRIVQTVRGRRGSVTQRA
jgi:hypothetical protein